MLFLFKFLYCFIIIQNLLLKLQHEREQLITSTFIPTTDEEIEMSNEDSQPVKLGIKRRINISTGEIADS